MIYIDPDMTITPVVIEPWEGDLESLITANKLGYANPWWKDSVLDFSPVVERKRVGIVKIPEVLDGQAALDEYFASIDAIHCTVYTMLNFFARLSISLKNCRTFTQVCALGTRGFVSARLSTVAIGKLDVQNRLTAALLDKVWKPHIHYFLCEV